MKYEKIEQPLAKSLKKPGWQLSRRNYAYILMAAVPAFLLWASFARLDVTVGAPAKAVPSQNQQVIQSLDAAIVQQIAVTVGEQVRRGQVLLRLKNSLAQAELGELEEKRDALISRLHRLGEEAGLPDPGALYGAVSSKASPAGEDLYENRLQSERMATFAESRRILAEQRNQKQAELGEYLVSAQASKTALDLARKEVALLAPLVQEGIVPELESIRNQRQVVDLERQYAMAVAASGRTRAAINEASARLSQLSVESQAKIFTEIVEAQNELRMVEQTINAARDRVSRTTVRSPIDAIVNRIEVTTTGEVVSPGKTIMEIIPAGDRLLFEARVNPADIGFIRKGQRADIKITAYDYAVYGMVRGKVIKVGANSIPDEEGQVYFSVIIQSDETTNALKQRDLPIIAGMTADVSVITGQRTVMQYLIKPFVSASQDALTER